MLLMMNALSLPRAQPRGASASLTSYPTLVSMFNACGVSALFGFP